MCGVYMEFTNKASKELKVYIEGNPVAVGELREILVLIWSQRSPQY